MIFELCFAGFITFFYYAYQFRRRSINQLDTSFPIDSSFTKKSKNNTTMSDDEFADPTGAQRQWQKNKVKIQNTPLRKGVGAFRWKKRQNPDPSPQDSPNSKRQKSNQIVEPEIVDVTDDDSEVNISEDSVTDVETEETNNSTEKKPSDSIIDFIHSFASNNSEESTPKKKGNTVAAYYKKVKKCIPCVEDVKNPPGMPSMISGVNVKFPVSPYRSQVSVMNAVIKGCKNQQHCLLESPTGSGKTLSLLCAALAWQESFKEQVYKQTEDMANGYGPNGESTTRANPGCSGASSDDEGCCKKKVLDEPEDLSAFMENMAEKDSSFQRIPKIYYGSRTHKQIEQVIREFRKTAYSKKPMTILSSREHTCIQQTKNISKTQLCQDLRDPLKNKGCPYYNESNKATMSSNERLKQLGVTVPWDIEDLVSTGRNNGSCPYFAARNMMEEADIIFCPYNYLIDPGVRDSMQISLHGHIVIVDEGHNMESICRDVGSANFREDELSEAIDTLELLHQSKSLKGALSGLFYQDIKNYLESVKKIIQSQYLSDPGKKWEEVSGPHWTGKDTWVLFCKHGLDEDKFHNFKNACNKAIEAFKQVLEDIQIGSKNQKKKLMETTINSVIKALIEKLVASVGRIINPVTSEDYRCVVTRSYHNDARNKTDEEGWIRARKPTALSTLKFMCMNPAIIFNDVAGPARSVILASGTLSPTSTFESELGTKFHQKLSASHVVTKDQVYVRNISKGPKGVVLKATYDNVQLLPFKDDLGNLMVEVCKNVPFGVLCFFSSYSMMLSQIERWQETDVWDKLTSFKKVLQEPRSNNDLDKVMSEFKYCIHNSNPEHRVNGALLMAVFRGKVAEGIDFSDNEARCVISVGIPYAVANDPYIKLKRQYNDINRNRGLLPGPEWYTIQAFRALNQALGRCIRHKNDWGAILLVDDRLNQFQFSAYLPKWIREMKLQDDDYSLENELKMFVKTQELRDKERSEK